MDHADPRSSRHPIALFRVIARVNDRTQGCTSERASENSNGLLWRPMRPLSSKASQGVG